MSKEASEKCVNEKKKGTRNDAGERHDERHEDPEDPLRGQLRPDRGEGRDRRIIYSMQITQAGWRRKREAPCRVHGIFFFFRMGFLICVNMPRRCFQSSFRCFARVFFVVPFLPLSLSLEEVGGSDRQHGGWGTLA